MYQTVSRLMLLSGRSTASSAAASVRSAMRIQERTASSMAETFKRPQGSIVAPFTPFKSNGDVDTGRISEYCDHLKLFEVPSTFVTGTTGEGLSLTVTERRQLLEAWMDNQHKFEHQIFHIGAPNLRDSQTLAQHAEALGVDAIACITPSYFKPQSVEDMVEYMKQVAGAAPNTPFYLYDINFMTQVNLDNVRFLELAEKTIPTLVGIKHSSPELNSLMRCHKYGGDKYHILLGSDDTMLPALSMGIRASVPSSYMSPLHNKIRHAYDRNDMKTAQQIQLRCMEISAIRAKYAAGPVGVFSASRAMMSMIGFDLGPPRLPLVQLSTEKCTALQQELSDYGFFDTLPKQ